MENYGLSLETVPSLREQKEAAAAEAIFKKQATHVTKTPDGDTINTPLFNGASIRLKSADNNISIDSPEIPWTDNQGNEIPFDQLPPVEQQRRAEQDAYYAKRNDIDLMFMPQGYGQQVGKQSQQKTENFVQGEGNLVITDPELDAHDRFLGDYQNKDGQWLSQSKNNPRENTDFDSKYNKLGKIQHETKQKRIDQANNSEASPTVSSPSFSQPLASFTIQL